MKIKYKQNEKMILEIECNDDEDQMWLKMDLELK